MKCRLHSSSCVLLNPGTVLMLCQNTAAMAKGGFEEAFLWKCCKQANENECMQLNRKNKKDHRKKRRKKGEKAALALGWNQKHYQLKNNLHFLDQISSKQAKNRQSGILSCSLPWCGSRRDGVEEKQSLFGLTCSVGFPKTGRVFSLQHLVHSPLLIADKSAHGYIEAHPSVSGKVTFDVLHVQELWSKPCAFLGWFMIFHLSSF